MNILVLEWDSFANEYVIEDDMMYSEDTTQDNTEEKIIFENITYKIKSLVSFRYF